jgi:glycoside/pentoside/hexuronide:cation symporter, GPH family
MSKDNLKKRIFDNKFLNSAISSSNVKLNEMLFGYILGPFGALVLNATLTSYLNIYYTDVLGLAGKEYSLFLGIFPIISMIPIVAANFIIGIIIDRTRTKQGKARPFLLLSAPLMALACFCIFAVPQSSVTVKIIWVVVSYNMYYSVAYVIYMMSHCLMVPLSTRNTKQRDILSVASNVASMGAAGLFASVLFPLLFLPYLGISQTRWISLMAVLSVIAFAAVLLEYYFTVERITKESINLDIHKDKIPIGKQIRAIVTDKYWWLIIIFYLIYQGGSCFKNNSLVYFCNYIVGTYNDGYTQTMLAFFSGIPMAVGIFFIWHLANKFGKRNVTMIGFAVSVAGGIICWVAPTDFTVVVIGQTIKSIGGVPGMYIMMALFADVLDHLECKNGFRCDGLSMSLYSTILVAMNGICMGLFNLMLSVAGYAAPTKVVNNTIVATQNGAAKSVIVWGFVGIEVVGHIILIVLLYFLKVEKNIDKEQKIILERQKEEVLASGGVWIEPEERARLEQEKYNREANEARIQELKERCVKKGLSFEEEESKYQKKHAVKKAKR